MNRISVDRYLEKYNLIWNSQSKDASESMPLGGHDIGCNVWVEDNEIYFYMAQSGTFDEEGRMAKAGRIRIKITPNPFSTRFQQRLKLEEGYVEILGESGELRTKVELWVDVARSVLHIEIYSNHEIQLQCNYETWRGYNSSFTNKDKITLGEERLEFCHRNYKTPIFDERIKEQGIECIQEFFPNVEKNRTFGGLLKVPGMNYIGEQEGHYGENDFVGYCLQSKQPVKKQTILVYLHQGQTETVEEWRQQLYERVNEAEKCVDAWDSTKQWWREFWNRSYVHIKPENRDEKDKDWQVGRNYQLFRYMLGCNAYGEYPTKFNGSLFTIDPILCSRREGFGSIYPDDRDWGGLIFTAQNQRLVYWPMIKNGDFDMMSPQFQFYTRTLQAMKKRTEFFFGLTDCACYPEQLDANGLSAFYGKYGLDYPLQVRCHHIDAIEFGYMIVQYAQYSGKDISEYMDFIDSTLNYYDKMYAKLDEQGKRIIFPSTALETFHAQQNINVWGREGAEAANYNAEEVAVTNPADVIAALSNLLEILVKNQYGTEEQQKKWSKLLSELPPIPTEKKNGYHVIAPCELPKEYVITNCELPQLYTVYPYHTYGLNKPETQLAINTYLYGWETEHQLLHISWHQNGIFAARLGLIQEARKYMWLKLADSNRRCPAFWGPGHDYVPDHNWGGSGMIGVQEMLIQCYDDKIYLFPAWPMEVDVEFKLWVEHETYVEVKLSNTKIAYEVTPSNRAKDIIIVPDKESVLWIQ